MKSSNRWNDMFADSADFCVTVLRLSEKRCAVKTPPVMSLWSVLTRTELFFHHIRGHRAD